jgi:hypothetical protein
MSRRCLLSSSPCPGVVTPSGSRREGAVAARVPQRYSGQAIPETCLAASAAVDLAVLLWSEAIHQ